MTLREKGKVVKLFGKAAPREKGCFFYSQVLYHPQASLYTFPGNLFFTMLVQKFESQKNLSAIPSAHIHYMPTDV